MKMKRVLCMIVVLAVCMGMFAGCGNKAGENGIVYVYNWGVYIDEAVIDMFEEETGIKVVYDEFETNEDMYAVIKTGSVKYDVVCPSDYMIER